MGHVKTIGFDRWPAQGSYLNSRVVVCFDYDTSRTIGGLVVRDDAEEPGRMLIRLDDGRMVDATECQYRPAQFDPCADATVPTDAAMRRVVEAARDWAAVEWTCAEDRGERNALLAAVDALGPRHDALDAAERDLRLADAEADAAYQRARAEALRHYADHSTFCERRSLRGGNCSCGATEAFAMPAEMPNGWRE